MEPWYPFGKHMELFEYWFNTLNAEMTEINNSIANKWCNLHERKIRSKVISA